MIAISSSIIIGSTKPDLDRGLDLGEPGLPDLDRGLDLGEPLI